MDTYGKKDGQFGYALSVLISKICLLLNLGDYKGEIFSQTLDLEIGLCWDFKVFMKQNQFISMFS